jgi:hypothetical protein
MTRRQTETVMTFDRVRKRMVESMVAAYVKLHPDGHARVVTQGSASWLQPDSGPPPTWTEAQLHKMHELAIEYEVATDFPADDAVLRWAPVADGIELWFERRSEEHRSSYPPPNP